MPASFALATQPAVKETQDALLPGEVVLSYLGDVYLSEILLWNLQISRGISMNHVKLHSWRGQAPRDLAELDTPEHTVWRGDAPPGANGITVVGKPIGHDEYVRKVVSDKIVEPDIVVQEIVSLPSSQVSWLLVLFCSVPRLNHLLRTVPPGQATVFTSSHDQHAMRAFNEILGVSTECDTTAAHGLNRAMWERERLVFLWIWAVAG